MENSGLPGEGRGPLRSPWKTFFLTFLGMGAGFFCCTTSAFGTLMSVVAVVFEKQPVSVVPAAYGWMAAMMIHVGVYCGAIIGAREAWGTSARRSLWCGLAGAIASIAAIFLFHQLVPNRLGAGFAKGAWPLGAFALFGGPFLALGLYQQALTDERKKAERERLH